MRYGLDTATTTGGRWLPLLLASLALAPSVALAQDPEDPPPADAQDEPVGEPTEVPPEAPRYLAPEDFDRLQSAWMGTGLAETVELGVASAGGRELRAVQLGAPGPMPLGERPAVLLLGGLDGVSIAGSEAVIALVDRLLASADLLPPGVTVIAVPWANPDGLARRLAGEHGGGGNDRGVDEDRDGAVDEDGPDDLDGDGVALEMLVEDPEGPWVRAGDGRFLRPAREGEAPRYRRAREGRDDDGDGRYNEDGPGGVSLDHNFPVGWEGDWAGIPSGPWPLSEPCSRALADLALVRDVRAVLLFQGNHGSLVTPGGRSPTDPVDLALGPLPVAADAPAFLALQALFAEATGRAAVPPLRLAEARGESVRGSPLDWFYASRGALTAEIGVWGPRVDGPARSAAEGATPREGRFRLPDEPVEGPLEGVCAEDRLWASWLDDTRGGIGFVDWQPVELGDGQRVLVGGWEPRTRENPPPDVLARAVEGLDAFLLALLRSLPRLEIELRETGRDGAVARLRARLGNAGGLPSGVGIRGAGRGVRLRLELPEGVVLLAGEESIELDHLPGGGASGEFEWLLAAPEGAVVRLHASSPLCEEVTREVRL